MAERNEPSGRSYRLLPFITAVFVTSLIISNIVAIKLVRIAGLSLPAAVILIPITYIFGDILTEVYGYAKARQVIWTGFFCNLLAVTVFLISEYLPATSFWSLGSFSTPDTAQQAYQAVLGSTPRILGASFIAYLVGDFLNSFVLAKMKLMTGGRFLWTRTIGSTIVGEGVDSMIFLTLAYFGTFSPANLGIAILSQWLFKVTYEVVATPITYIVVNWLKRVEKEDYFDRETNFNPITF